MQGTRDLDFLEIAVGARMKVRPGDGGRIGVVDLVPGRIRIEAAGMEIMRLANAAECADGRSQIHVISRDQEATAVTAETGDALAVLYGQSIADVDRE